MHGAAGVEGVSGVPHGVHAGVAQSEGGVMNRKWAVISSVGEAETYLRFHGLAYRHWGSYRMVTAIFPLNLAIGWTRWLWNTARHAVPRERDREFRRAWLAGRHAGMDEVLAKMEQNFLKRVDETMVLWRRERDEKRADKARA
jgi:hypothetical protein